MIRERFSKIYYYFIPPLLFMPDARPWRYSHTYVLLVKWVLMTLLIKTLCG